MIYGAYGYTGELIAREAVRRGLKPILAGRSESKLTPLARELGLAICVFDVANVGSKFDDVDVLLNCAGPFSTTAELLVEACIMARTHYVDITGEIEVFQMCRCLDARATAAGVLLCPGAGFDIVPTDCLAATLKHRLPDAQTIDLAFSFGTRPSIGTAKTSIASLQSGGLVRRDHLLKRVRNAYRFKRVAFPSGRRWAVTIPWGDVFTGGVSTGVPNGMVFASMPLSVGLFMWLTNPMRRFLGLEWSQRALFRVAEFLFEIGPNEAARESQRAEFWGEATNSSGRRVTARMSAPNVYALTADTAVEIAARCLTPLNRAGYVTPSMLFGHSFMLSRPGVVFDWAERT
jgi:short subunit dehydrogenase-like uncharacterized protein